MIDPTAPLIPWTQDQALAHLREQYALAEQRIAARYGARTSWYGEDVMSDVHELRLAGCSWREIGLLLGYSNHAALCSAYHRYINPHEEAA